MWDMLAQMFIYVTLVEVRNSIHDKKYPNKVEVMVDRIKVVWISIGTCMGNHKLSEMWNLVEVEVEDWHAIEEEVDNNGINNTNDSQSPLSCTYHDEIG